jgi:hypothetical protein
VYRENRRPIARPATRQGHASDAGFKFQKRQADINTLSNVMEVGDLVDAGHWSASTAAKR